MPHTDADADIVAALAATPPDADLSARLRPHLIDDPREVRAGIGAALIRLSILADGMVMDFATDGIREGDAAEVATIGATLRLFARRG